MESTNISKNINNMSKIAAVKICNSDRHHWHGWWRHLLKKWAKKIKWLAFLINLLIVQERMLKINVDRCNFFVHRYFI
jgi:hypothetical protein